MMQPHSALTFLFSQRLLSLTFQEQKVSRIPCWRLPRHCQMCGPLKPASSVQSVKAEWDVLLFSLFFLPSSSIDHKMNFQKSYLQISTQLCMVEFCPKHICEGRSFVNFDRDAETHWLLAVTRCDKNPGIIIFSKVAISLFHGSQHFQGSRYICRSCPYIDYVAQL